MFRPKLLGGTAIPARASPKASSSSGAAPSQLRAFRLELVGCTATPTCASPKLPIALGQFRHNSVRLPEACRWHCHANARLVRGFRQPRGVTARVSLGLVGLPTPRQPWLPALRSGIRHWGQGPRRSGPQRLGSGRCNVALTTLSLCRPPLLFLTPVRGGVFPLSSATCASFGCRSCLRLSSAAARPEAPALVHSACAESSTALPIRRLGGLQSRPS